jgi:hypothetical protein
VEVRGTDLENVSLVVHQGSNIQGRILVDGIQTPARVQITLQPEDTASRVTSVIGNTYTEVGRFQAPIEPDGSFTIPVVPQGRYRFQVLLNTAPFQLTEVNRGQSGARVLQSGLSELPREAYLADIRQGGVSIYDVGFTVGKDATPVEILINSPAGSIEGTVYGPDKKPITGTAAILVPSGTRRENPDLYKVTPTDAQGRFAFAQIPPGDYKVFSWENVQSGAYQNAEFLKTYEGRGTFVTVRAGVRSTVDVFVIMN